MPPFGKSAQKYPKEFNGRSGPIVNTEYGGRFDCLSQLLQSSILKGDYLSYTHPSKDEFVKGDSDRLIEVTFTVNKGRIFGLSLRNVCLINRRWPPSAEQRLIKSRGESWVRFPPRFISFPQVRLTKAKGRQPVFENVEVRSSLCDQAYAWEFVCRCFNVSLPCHLLCCLHAMQPTLFVFLC